MANILEINIGISELSLSYLSSLKSMVEGMPACSDLMMLLNLSLAMSMRG